MTKVTGDVDVLNDLMKTLIDSEDGYIKAAEVANDPELKTRFRNAASRRREVLTSLKACVASLGAEPEDDGTLLASAHRKFMQLAALVENNDEAAANAVETGEDHLRNKLEEALESDLSGQCRSVVQEALNEVRHDEKMADFLAANHN